MIRTLKAGEVVPSAPPRRYVASHGYVRLRWTVGPGPRDEVEVYEHRTVRPESMQQRAANSPQLAMCLPRSAAPGRTANGDTRSTKRTRALGRTGDVTVGNASAYRIGRPGRANEPS